MSEVNILLLGETGVGKTTFANSLLNYLSYDSLEDAKYKFIQLTPTSFQLPLCDYETRLIATGTDHNECQYGGVSSTQAPIAHSLQYKGRMIRIIDTPGLGDTRGLAYDEKNANSLINYLKRLDHLNGICIMLKPTESRSTVLFNFCIQKVLSQLNKDVLNNVVFVFTNSRSSSYKAGDAIRPLQVALTNAASPLVISREKTFCLDNEVFRYLAAMSNGVEFPDMEAEAYQRSWSISALESKRFLDHILSLRPSPTQIIVTLRDANAIIGSLAQPLMEIMIQHQKSLDKIDRHRKDILDHQNSIEELKTRLWVPMILYKTTTTTDTQTKAGHKVDLEASFLQMLSGSLKYKYIDMTKTHTEQVVEPYEGKQEDASVKANLLTESNKLKLVEDNVKELEEMQQEFSAESETIADAAAKFLKFLSENGVIRFTDAFQQYIEQSLDEELMCGGSTGLVSNLQSLLLRYKLKKNNLSDVNASDVKVAVSKLLNLKHAGAIFRRIYNQILQ